MQRYGAVIGLREDAVEEYERQHAAVWPEVLAALSRANLRNYTIFRHGLTLFTYREYVGEDYEADMAELDRDPVCQRWQELMTPLQASIDPATPGRWTELPEVFHLA